MENSAIIETLLQWALGLLAVAIIAIVAGYADTSRKLAVLIQRVTDHIAACELLHAKQELVSNRHDKEIRALENQ